MLGLGWAPAEFYFIAFCFEQQPSSLLWDLGALNFCYITT